MRRAVIIVVAMVLLTANAESSHLLMGADSVIDGNAIESFGRHIRLADCEFLIEEACDSTLHWWT